MQRELAFDLRHRRAAYGHKRSEILFLQSGPSLATAGQLPYFASVRGDLEPAIIEFFRSTRARSRIAAVVVRSRQSRPRLPNYFLGTQEHRHP